MGFSVATGGGGGTAGRQLALAATRAAHRTNRGDGMARVDSTSRITARETREPGAASTQERPPGSSSSLPSNGVSDVARHGSRRARLVTA